MSKQRVPFIGIEHKDFEPNVTALANLLPEVGFRPLIEATEETLPVGSVVVIFNCKNNTMFPGVVLREYTLLGFHYTSLNELEDPAPEFIHMNRKYEFEDKLYKVICHLHTNDFAQKGSVKNAIQRIGFRSLAKATPEDLPEGSLVLLTTASGYVSAAIVRTLSMVNKRFLFWSPSPIVAGNWHPNVIMDNLTPFENYSYLVII